MADDAVVTRLATVGLPQYLRDFQAADAAQNQLLETITSTGVRQRVVYDEVARAAEESAKKQEEAAKTVEEANQRIAASLTIVSGSRGRTFEDRQASIQAIIDGAKAQARAQQALAQPRNELGQFITQDAANQAAQFKRTQDALKELAGQYSDTANAAKAAGELMQHMAAEAAASIKAQTEAQAKFNAALADEQAKLRVVASQGPLTSNVQGVTQVPFAGLGAPNPESSTSKQIAQQQALLNSQRQTAAGLLAHKDAAGEVEKAELSKAKAIDEEGNAQDRTGKRGITYLSTLSAIHAASFLLGGQTFSNVGSLTVLGAAFSKLGPAASVAGVGFGAALLAVQSFDNAASAVKQTIETVTTSVLTLAATLTATLVAAGTAGVRAAAGLEQQFALLQAISGAAIPGLVLTEQTVKDLALEFGISGAKVTEAASLFVRAGGSIEEANQGATRAILELVTASGGELQAAEAARAMAVALRQFNLEGKDSERVASVLIGVAQNSALSFTELTQAFQQAVPGSRTLGIELEDLGAVIGVLGNQLRGTVAGTSFKQFLLDLVNPSAEAAAQLEQLGVFAFDAAGKSRPLRDIIVDLNKALGEEAIAAGRLTEAQRANALATIFQSRAGLAGAILTQDAVKRFDEFRNALSDTSGTEVAARVLNTLNSQAGRLAVSIEQLGQAFGSPLLTPLKEATQTATAFFHDLLPQAELAGQVVGVILGGQGFGELQQRIQEVTGNPVISTFFTRIVDLALQAKDAIANNIVPALLSMLGGVSDIANESGRVEDLNKVFDNLSTIMSRVTGTAVVLIGKVPELVQQFANGEGAGGRLRAEIERLAGAAINQLLVGLVKIPPTVVVAVGAFTALGAIARKLLETFIQVGPVIGGILSAIGVQLDQFGRNVGNTFDLIGSAAHILVTFENLRKGQATIEEFGASIDEIRQKTLRPSQEPADGFITTLGKVITDTSQVAAGVLVNLDKIEADSANTIQTLKDLAGEIPTFFTNLAQEVEQAQATVGGGARGGTTGAAQGFIDPKKIEKAKQQVEELGRDLTTKLENINRDAADKTQAVISNAIDRITDLFDKAEVAVAKLKRDTEEQISDLFSNITQQRQDRDFLDSFRKGQEDALTIVQNRLARQDLAEQQARDFGERQIQRKTEDVLTAYQRQTDGVERNLQRQEQAAERSEQRRLQLIEDRLQKQQDAELTAFTRLQEDQATARTNARELAAAKTPAEKAAATAQQKQAREDTQFQRGQQDQLTQFRIKQEKVQKDFRQKNEDALIAFRQSQEDAALSRRIQNEDKLQAYRRLIEDLDQKRKDELARTDLERRIVREGELTRIRRENEQALQDERDRLENAAAERRKQRILREAQEREADINNQAQEQANRLTREAQQQLDSQQLATLKQIQTLGQQLADKADDIQRQAGTNGIPGLASLIAEINGLSSQAISAAQTRNAAAQDQINGALEQRQEQLQNQLNFQQPSTPVVGAQTPTQAVVAAGRIVANIILPRDYVDLTARAMFLALQTYGAAKGDVTNATGDVSVTVAPDNQIFSEMLQFFASRR